MAGHEAGYVYVENYGDNYRAYLSGDTVLNGHGVSPAFNVSLNSVLFSSYIPSSVAVGEPGAEYKLTLLDNDISVGVTQDKIVSRNGNAVTVPYTITNSSATSEPTHVGLLLMDSEWSAGTSSTDGFAFMKVPVDGTGNAAFTMPDEYAEKICGTNYYAYLIALDENGEKETDYASTPVSITVPTIPARPEITSQPQDLILTYGNESDSSVSVEASTAEGNTLSYQWYENSTASNTGGTLIEGATLSSCVIPEKHGAGTSYYYCKVTATNGEGISGMATASDTAAVTVNPKKIYVSGIKANDKTYDGNTSATLDYSEVVYGGKLDGDSLSVNDTGVFESAGVGTGKTVTISNHTLTGASVANYTLAPATDQQTTATASIAKKLVTISGVTVQDKEYDGTMEATPDISDAAVTGLCGSDTITFTVNAEFDNEDTGTDKGVTLSGWTITGGGDTMR